MRLGVDAALVPDVTLLMVDGDTFISFTFNLQTVSRTREPKHDAAPQLHLLFSTNVKPAGLKLELGVGGATTRKQHHFNKTEELQQHALLLLHVMTCRINFMNSKR